MMKGSKMKELIAQLEKYGNTLVADSLRKLSGSELENLKAQIEELDLELLASLADTYVKKKPTITVPEDLAPAPFYPFPAKTPEEEELYKKAEAEGKRLLSSGKVAMLVVAGGQGTRLGFDGPKGTYPITPVNNKTLFQYFAEKIARIGEKYSSPLYWFIMTSKINDKATKDFFAENGYFGLHKENIIFFTQGTMPAMDHEGKLLMAEKDSLALSPDGHGGTLLALKRSGALAKMKEQGIDFISYFQIDNPLVPMADPLFLGLHSLTGSEMSARMLPKTNPYEKLGNFCISNGRLNIIEYSDMPSSLAEKKNPDGTLAFLSGSPAIHVISRTFVERLTSDGRLKLPWHRADKKVPYINEKGELVKPDSPNAVKLESFIFDALPLAEKTMILEGARNLHFAPVKNPDGVDSAVSCREMLCERDALYFAKAGLELPRKEDGSLDCLIEISPRSACDEEDAVALLSRPGVKVPARGEKASYE